MIAKRPLTFKQGDMSRAVKVLEKAGKQIAAVRVTANGFEIVVGNASNMDDVDKELRAFGEQHGMKL
jgi:hypothetical protein